MLAGRLPPSTGVVTIDGRPSTVNDFNYMLQDSNRLLFPHLTLRENLALLKASAVKENNNVARISEMLFRDDKTLKQYPIHCSGGQKQRAVLGRTIADIPSFSVSLLDEPFAQISQDVKPDVYSFLRGIVQRSDCHVLMVTHDISEAMIVGDQVVVISSEAPQVFDVSVVTDAATYVKASAMRNAVRRAIFSTDGPPSIKDM